MFALVKCLLVVTAAFAGMLADARIDRFAAIMRKRSAALMLWVLDTSNSYSQLIAERLDTDCLFMEHWTRAYIIFLDRCSIAHGFSLGPNDVVMHSLTNSNPHVSEPLLPTTASIMMSQTFLPTRPTIITCHSHDDSVAGNFNAFVVPAHLTADVNVIAVDWSLGAEMYSNALGHAPQVGRVIAQFINILHDSFGYNPNQIRIVGVGLGAHIAGIAARHVNAEIPSVIAIDPSFHGWTHHPEILNANDAITVEVIHTTAGAYGYDYPLGDLDFYPNGGTHQNGCGFDINCSHVYGYAFYAESVTREVNGGNKFLATACESYDEAISQQCDGDRDVHFGGTDSKSGNSGIYWFTTNAQPPFARD